MSDEWPLPLLPNEPRVSDPARQQPLTERFLLPQCSALEQLFCNIRARLDGPLARAQALKWGKPYPLGQCLEISLAVKRELRMLNPATLTGGAAQGHAALAAFLRHGGQMHQVWGDLRGEYFQNAFLAGTLYIDASNDTVNPNKPAVEIMPLAQARFVAVEDFQHFARVASRYWHATLHPNHLLPALAPYYPFIVAIPGAGFRLEADSAYMVLLAQRQRFGSSLMALEAPALTADLHGRLRHTLRAAKLPLQMADTSVLGRAQALQHCKQIAQAGQALDDEKRAQLGQAIAAVNRCWASGPP